MDIVGVGISILNSAAAQNMNALGDWWALEDCERNSAATQNRNTLGDWYAPEDWEWSKRETAF